MNAEVCANAKAGPWLALAAMSVLSIAQAKEPLDYVDPFVGTSATGHTTPAACEPFGLVQAGPDTGDVGWQYCSGYRFEDTSLLGFSQTHLSGTGGADLGDLLVLPFTTDQAPVRVAMDKSTERARPGYYAVTLANGVACEMSAGAHTAIYRFRFPRGSSAKLVIDLQHQLGTTNGVIACEGDFSGDRLFTGWRQTRGWTLRNFFYALETSVPCKGAVRDIGGRRYVLDFGAATEVMVRIGISTRSIAGAKRNLVAEIPDWDFAAVCARAATAWRAVLARMTAEGSDTELRTFYTSIYHLCFQPNLISDVGEKPRYSTFSLWDTFRAAHPLYTIITPEMVAPFINSMLVDASINGYLPVWTLWGSETDCMIATHSVPVVADAYLKGFDGVDWGVAYTSAWRSLKWDHGKRLKEEWPVLDAFGYFPADLVYNEHVSRTLECAYDDACLARFAAARKDTQHEEFFRRRSYAWSNHFDRVTGFMRPRKRNGEWVEPFSPFVQGVWGYGYTEGNAWQYTWHVMQHPNELIALLGGKEKFVEKLDTLFTLPSKVPGMREVSDITGLIGQYAHGNEPSHHIAYFYPYAGRPDRTAEVVREVIEKFYRPTPDGCCGNDDCGQMSAWYLFSVAGFYPFDPCGGDFVLGAPQLPRVAFALPGGKSFVVVAKNLSKANKYVKSATLNGRQLDLCDPRALTYAEIRKGGELVFEMVPKAAAAR